MLNENSKIEDFERFMRRYNKTDYISKSKSDFLKKEFDLDLNLINEIKSKISKSLELINNFKENIDIFDDYFLEIKDYFEFNLSYEFYYSINISTSSYVFNSFYIYINDDQTLNSMFEVIIKNIIKNTEKEQENRKNSTNYWKRYIYRKNLNKNNFDKIEINPVLQINIKSDLEVNEMFGENMLHKHQKLLKEKLNECLNNYLRRIGYFNRYDLVNNSYLYAVDNLSYKIKIKDIY